MLDQVEEAYETVFVRTSADDSFLEELTRAYLGFTRRTAKRPITPREVKDAQRVFRDECRTVMAEAKRRI